VGVAQAAELVAEQAMHDRRIRDEDARLRGHPGGFCAARVAPGSSWLGLPTGP
jgi:hypothetical protein